jgi:hypothetical protein
VDRLSGWFQAWWFSGAAVEEAAQGGQERSRDEATACQLVPRVPGVPRFTTASSSSRVGRSARSRGRGDGDRPAAGDGAHTPYLSGRS